MNKLDHWLPLRSHFLRVVGVFLEIVLATPPAGQAATFVVTGGSSLFGVILIGGIRVREWISAPGRNRAGGSTTQLQAASNLRSGGFVDIGSPMVLAGSGDKTVNQVEPAAALRTAARFYRVRLVP